MKTIQHFLLLLISCVLLQCSTPVYAQAQSMTGKWQMYGRQDALHFSKEGAFAWIKPAATPILGVWYTEGDILGVIFIEEEDLVLYRMVPHSQGKMYLENIETNDRTAIVYKGRHQISQEYVDLVVEHFDEGLGENQTSTASATPNKPTESYSPSTTNSTTYSSNLYSFPPRDRSLVGNWRPQNDWEQSFAFDANGYFYQYFEDESYASVGLYKYDGRTLILSWFNGVDGGTTGTKRIQFNSGSQFTVHNSDSYKSVYTKKSSSGLPSYAKGQIRAYLHYKQMLDTWWYNDDETLIFLTEFYLLVTLL